MSADAHDRPAKVEARPGRVREIKPDGTAVEMTPKAAVETGVALIEAAAEADGKGKLAADADTRTPRYG